VLRAYLEHGCIRTRPGQGVVWSHLPRRKKPQRRRFRQFHQIDCELLGLASHLIDAEAITSFNVLGGLNNMTVRLGQSG